MAKKSFFVGILSVLLLFGLVVGCDSGGDSGEGDDGALTWTAVADSTFVAPAEIWSITYGGAKFVAGGSKGKMAYSADGVTWTAVVDSKFTTAIRGIAYGEGTFVAVGEALYAAHSSDGITWTKGSNDGAGSYCIAYGDEKFVAGTNGGGIMYSEDGITWDDAEDIIVSGGTIHGIAYGGNKFVAGVSNGRMAYSADGITWTAVADSALDNIEVIHSIAYGGGKFVAGGLSGAVAYSTDGVTWTAEKVSAFKYGESSFDQGFFYNIYGIAYGGGKFVAGGDFGRMAYSNAQE
jgi:hypothetical protein